MVNLFNENDMKVLQIIMEHGPTSKSEATHYGMKETTFQNHAKKLVAMNILVETRSSSATRGAPKTLYELNNDGEI